MTLSLVIIYLLSTSCELFFEFWEHSNEWNAAPALVKSAWLPSSLLLHIWSGLLGRRNRHALGDASEGTLIIFLLHLEKQAHSLCSFLLPGSRQQAETSIFRIQAAPTRAYGLSPSAFPRALYKPRGVSLHRQGCLLTAPSVEFCSLYMVVS